jgi:hypothetical protein
VAYRKGAGLGSAATDHEAQKNVGIGNARSSKPQPQNPQAAPRSWRDVLPVHPAADLFPMLGRDELLELGEDIKKNGLRCPIVIWSRDKYGTEYLLDGRNRLEAMELAGLLCLSNGTLALNRGGVTWPLEREYLRWDTHAPDGVSDHEHPSHLVASLNIRRRHLTAEQKRELIAKLIKATPKKSDRQIATATKTDHKTVASVRAEQEARGEIPHVSTRTDSKGRQQPANKARSEDLERRVAADAAKRAERKHKDLERRVAERRAKRKREAEAFCKQYDLEEAQTKTEAERLAAGLIGADQGLARALHEFLVQCGADAIDLMDALGHLLGPEAALDDGLDIPAALRRAP